MKKITLTLGTLITTIAPITIVVSCNGGEEKDKHLLSLDEKYHLLVKEINNINLYNSKINLLMSEKQLLMNPAPHMVTTHHSTLIAEQRLLERASREGITGPALQSMLRHLRSQSSHTEMASGTVDFEAVRRCTININKYVSLRTPHIEEFNVLLSELKESVRKKYKNGEAHSQKYNHILNMQSA